MGHVSFSSSSEIKWRIFLCKILRSHQIAFVEISTAFRAIVVAVLALSGDLLDAKNTVVVNVIGTLGNPTLLCILGSRMFFNLKEAAEYGVNVGTNWSSYSHSAIHYEEMHEMDNM